MVQSGKPPEASTFDLELSSRLQELLLEDPGHLAGMVEEDQHVGVTKIV